MMALAIGSGLIWIRYSAGKVRELEDKRASLAAEIAANNQKLLSIKQEIELGETVRENLRQEKSPTIEETDAALKTLAVVQERIGNVVNATESPTVAATPTQTPTPTSTPAPTPIQSPSVPNVQGLTFAEATDKVTKAGLSVRKVAQKGNAPPGTVLYQDPLAGTRLLPQAAVSLYVASESEETVVPQLKGLIFGVADQKVRDARLNVRKVDQKGNGPPGTILYQDPVANSLVRIGTTVSLYVVPGP
jgi:hypothetical protein